MQARKQTEFRDREASLKLQMEVVDRSHHEIADLAVRVFELSQTLKAIPFALLREKRGSRQVIFGCASRAVAE